MNNEESRMSHYGRVWESEESRMSHYGRVWERHRVARSADQEKIKKLLEKPPSTPVQLAEIVDQLQGMRERWEAEDHRLALEPE